MAFIQIQIVFKKFLYILMLRTPFSIRMPFLDKCLFACKSPNTCRRIHQYFEHLTVMNCLKKHTIQACLQKFNNQQKSFSVDIYKELTRKCISKQIRPCSRRWLKTERICKLVFTQDIIAHSGPSHNGYKERYCRFQTMVSLYSTPGSSPRRPSSIFHGNGSIRSYY